VGSFFLICNIQGKRGYVDYAKEIIEATNYIMHAVTMIPDIFISGKFFFLKMRDEKSNFKIIEKFNAQIEYKKFGQ